MASESTKKLLQELKGISDRMAPGQAALQRAGEIVIELRIRKANGTF